VIIEMDLGGWFRWVVVDDLILVDHLYFDEFVELYPQLFITAK